MGPQALRYLPPCSSDYARRKRIRRSDSVSRLPDIEVDLTGSRRRRSRMARYVESELLSPERDFICPHYAQCRKSIRRGDVFREGTMSHVGGRFDLRRNG